jgi:xylan 1,4-beta-xylosidase
MTKTSWCKLTLLAFAGACLAAPLTCASSAADTLPSSGPGALPGLRKLMDTYLRDTSIGIGPDGAWYMTGTSDPPDAIRLWRSRDPEHRSWESLGVVWKPGQSPWHKPYLAAGCPLWAPEVHYLKGTFWLTYSFPGWDNFNPKYSGCGLLKSISGREEGPYEDMHPSERLGDEIDASLFQDGDGTVYFLWHNSKIARMKSDMSGFAEPYRWLKTSVGDDNPKHHSELCAKVTQDSCHVCYEGMSMFKANGRYYWCGSEAFEGRYSCAIATSTNLYGPYSARYEALPYCGHNNFFRDSNRQWWATFFGHDDGAPWHERPGVLPVEIGPDGVVRPQAARRAALPQSAAHQ